MITIFYRNLRLLILTICLIIVWGLSSYQVLPQMEDPELTTRWALITTRFPGANAYRVESLVTDKIEEELSEIEEIETISSTSRLGLSTISIEINNEIVDVERVQSRIRDRLDDVTSQLPEDALEPEYQDLVSRAYTLMVGLSWDFESAPNYSILRRLAEELENDLSTINGTEQVELFGAPQEEITVEIDPFKLASLGITPQELSQQIRLSDAKVSAGQFRSNEHDILLEVDGELESTERIRQIPIRFGDLGQFTRLEDLAKVKKGIVEPPTEVAIVNGKPGIILAVLMDSNQRIDRWAAAARQELEKFQQKLTRGVKLEIIFDQSIYVDKRLNGLFINLLLGTLLVIGSSFVMMGWKSAVVIGSTLPLSVLMVFGGMNLFHIPLHQMSVMGLVVALGLLVDNAIVVVDEVNKELEQGIKPHQAISKSISYLTIPLLASTLTTVLTFLPIALVSGPTGEFVRTVAISVILALLSSLFLTLTVVPALTGRLNDFTARVKTREASSWWNRGFSDRTIAQVYANTLKYIFKKPVLGIVLALILPVTGFVMATNLEEQFFPPAERDQFQIELELSSSASLAETQVSVLQLNSILQNYSEIVNVHWLLGRSAPKFYYNLEETIEDLSNYAQALVQITSPTGRSKLIQSLQQELNAAFPSARILVRQLEQGPPVDAPIELRLYGSDLELLKELGDRVRLEITQVKDVIYTTAALSETSPKFKFNLDEEEAKLAGLDNTAIARQLDTNLEGVIGGSVLEGTEELPVRVRLSNSHRSNLDQIASLDLLPNNISREDNLSTIPLDAVSKIELASELTTISRRNRERINNIQVFIKAGILPSKVLKKITAHLATSKFKLPPDYFLEFGGEQAKRNEALSNLFSTIGIVLILMIATLVLSFSSFRLAGIIAIVAICSMGLGLFSLWIFGYPFGFMAILGTVGLIGIAINDSIVILAAIHSHIAARQGSRKAIAQIVFNSTRHVLTTTITTVIGFIPLLIAGGEFWPPLAICIAGGVGGATFIALFFVPCTYLSLVNYYRKKTGFPMKVIDDKYLIH
ncbi:MAG: efflux RND transporter permease subunit [Xenococcus sp. MO_188.B8]|nr:efflux RND transporter permease subunit [Xenococcus sp. MO_188.B8]